MLNVRLMFFLCLFKIDVTFKIIIKLRFNSNLSHVSHLSYHGSCQHPISMSTLRIFSLMLQIQKIMMTNKMNFVYGVWSFVSHFFSMYDLTLNDITLILGSANVPIETYEPKDHIIEIRN
jgi:hypothetical protein